MRLCFLLLVCVIAVSAWPIEDLSLRVSGGNGWYVPQKDGALRWVSRAEGERDLAHYEAQETIMGRLSTNTVNFYLYTLRNTNAGQQIKANRASIDASNFNPENPTRITIHGWNSNYKDGVNTKIAAAWFLSGDYNMIAVDWVRGRSLEYASSVAAASGAGKKIAALVDFLVKEYGMSLDTLEVVGFSLGAHVAGHTAKQVASGEVGKVVGLDPAMPLISYSNTAKRLASDDARYVESIHTAGGTMGFTKPIGKAAFYVNGGKSQPGCGIDITGSCAHTRAVTYYVESLRFNNFPTQRCDSYKEANKKACGDKYSSVLMGATVNIYVAEGIFYVPVNKQSPFGLGELLDDSEGSTTVAPDTPTTAADDATTADGEDDSTTAAPEEGSTTPAPGGEDDSTTAAPEDGGDDSTTAAPEDGGDDSTTAAPEDGGDDSTTGAPEDGEDNDSTTAEPEDGEDDSTTAAPEDGGDDSTTSAPEDGEDDSTTAAPEDGGDDSTTASPEEDSTTDAPEEDSTTSAPEDGEDDSTTAAPEDGGDDSTTASPEEDYTTDAREEDSTTSAPEEDSTTSAPEDGEDDSTTADPEDGGDDSTTASPEEDSTTDAPEEDSTTSAPEDDSTTADPEDGGDDSTTASPEEDSTTDAPEEDSTTSAPEDDSTTAAPEDGGDDSTTASPEEDSTTDAPEEDSTTAAPEDGGDDTTTAATPEDPTTTTEAPEDPNTPITDAPGERPSTDAPEDNDVPGSTKNIYIFNLFLINVKVNKK
ncbi:GL23628 [Drosophila persimilis]|uniref:GL23628 n=1 Tax=Drosophila persimilis TaxID=7234 RepID=B4G2D9_DROPE|nr:GL23628 [Drosophila persimilis]